MLGCLLVSALHLQSQISFKLSAAIGDDDDTGRRGSISANDKLLAK